MFVIKFRQNPIQYHNSNHRQRFRAKKQITRSLHNVNHKITCLRKHKSYHLNIDKNYRRVICGLSYLYSFKPRSFFKDNFITKHRHTYLKSNHQLMTIATWLSTIQHISQQLNIIHNADNLMQIQAKYHGYVLINGIHVSHKEPIANHARRHLAKLGNGQRYRFVGTYARFGRKSSGGLSLLLKHITYHGKEVTDHLWFNYTQGFRKLGHLQNHQKISFEDRVKKYRKGYVPMDFVRHYDYKLSYPSKIAKR